MLIDIIALFVDKNAEYESLLAAVIVVTVIAGLLLIAGVILLILYIKLRAANKRSCLVFVFCVRIRCRRVSY